MTLALLWAYTENGAIISRNNKLFLITNNKDYFCVSALGTNENKRVVTLQGALKLIYSNDKIKKGFRVAKATYPACKVGERPFDWIVPAIETGAVSSDIPVLEQGGEPKSYWWGTDGEKQYILVPDFHSGRVNIEICTLTEALENRRGRYYNIVGVDNEIAIKNRVYREKVPNALDFMDYKDLIYFKEESTPVCNVECILPYSSQFIDKCLSDKNYYYANLSKYRFLSVYGQFGRYAGAVKQVDNILNETERILNDPRYYLLQFMKGESVPAEAYTGLQFENLLLKYLKHDKNPSVIDAWLEYYINKSNSPYGSCMSYNNYIEKMICYPSPKYNTLKKTLAPYYKKLYDIAKTNGKLISSPKTIERIVKKIIKSPKSWGYVGNFLNSYMNSNEQERLYLFLNTCYFNTESYRNKPDAGAIYNNSDFYLNASYGTFKHKFALDYNINRDIISHIFNLCSKPIIGSIFGDEEPTIFSATSAASNAHKWLISGDDKYALFEERCSKDDNPYEYVHSYIVPEMLSVMSDIVNNIIEFTYKTVDKSTAGTKFVVTTVKERLDRIVDDYICGVISVMLKQHNIKLTRNKILKIKGYLLESIDLYHLFCLCIRLRYLYFNPVTKQMDRDSEWFDYKVPLIKNTSFMATCRIKPNISRYSSISSDMFDCLKLVFYKFASL